MLPCCADGSPTSLQWSICRNGPWLEYRPRAQPQGVFLVTTIAGVTGLWPALLADTRATVLVKMNALRLLAPSKIYVVHGT